APPAPAGQPPTFAQLQQRGMPRPPPAIAALYGAAGRPAPNYGRSTAAPPPPAATGGYSTVERPGTGLGWQPDHEGTPSTRGAPTPTPYRPTGQLDQSNIEGYLYDLLANPTATPTYQNSMRRIGADIDTDAS